ncbi:hypothetical protein JW948_13955 [bacterium]|nr:hypothetical protein [bacterium]
MTRTLGAAAILLPLLILFFHCGNPGSPVVYWPGNELCIQDCSWKIPLGDSTQILLADDGIWQLPMAPPVSKSTLQNHCHRSSGTVPVPAFLGRTDQVVVHESGYVRQEFYRFEGGAVLLLGYETSLPEKSWTVYDPPLILVPPDAWNHIPVSSESVPEIYNSLSDSGTPGQKTRLRIIEKESGTVQLDSIRLKARLFEMIMSNDETVHFGETPLIAPDAVMVRHHLLIAERVGPVLEWGIRSPGTGRYHDQDGRETDDCVIEITRFLSMVPDHRELHHEKIRND